jgi:DNA-binding GntR family transcriptional regulator
VAIVARMLRANLPSIDGRSGSFSHSAKTMAQPFSTPRTITQTLSRQLRDEILAGEIPPGTHLRQAEVAERFKVSTTPVREAFAALTREGLLVGTAHRGVIVFHPTVEDLRETYEIRIPLEVLATRRAVQNMTDADVAELHVLVGQMADELDDRDRHSALNERFHARLYAASGRLKLQRLISDLRKTSAAYLRLYATADSRPDVVHREHVRILEACESRDADAAAGAMEAHLRHTLQATSRLIESRADADAAIELGP